MRARLVSVLQRQHLRWRKGNYYLIEKARYTLDEEQHTLTLYTDNEQSTFYLDYEFRGKDTLLLHNKLNAEHIQAIYVRQSTTTKQE